MAAKHLMTTTQYHLERADISKKQESQFMLKWKYFHHLSICGTQFGALNDFKSLLLALFDELQLYMNWIGCGRQLLKSVFPSDLLERKQTEKENELSAISVDVYGWLCYVNLIRVIGRLSLTFVGMFPHPLPLSSSSSSSLSLMK